MDPGSEAMQTNKNFIKHAKMMIQMLDKALNMLGPDIELCKSEESVGLPGNTRLLPYLIHRTCIPLPQWAIFFVIVSDCMAFSATCKRM
jgi:hypothetical protein